MQPRWQTLAKNPLPPPDDPHRLEAILKTLLANRGLVDQEAVKLFLNPPDPLDLNPRSLAINQEELTKAISRINQAKAQNEQIVIFGDYDCDGVCAVAILWETLNRLSFAVMPYLPHRIDEGFGLSKQSLTRIKAKFPQASLIITADTGITNAKEIGLAKQLGFDVIITDHHQLPKDRPKAAAVVHTTMLSGSGVAWILAKALNHQAAASSLDLLTLATIGDLTPLTGPNRAIVYHGLKAVNQSSRLGLKALATKAGLSARQIGVYEVSHIIVPRLNAAGRLKHPIDALRLLCTNRPERADQLASQLNLLNNERRNLTEAALRLARETVSTAKPPGLIFLANETFHEGIIGLIAGRLADEFSRPAFVIAKGKDLAKASARSVPGFNLTEALEAIREHLIDGGGHPLAGGFTAKSKNLNLIKEKLLIFAQKMDLHAHQPTLKVDLKLELTDLTWELLEKINQLKPFGIGNPTPVFAADSVPVGQVRWVGQNRQHLKFSVFDQPLAAIGFAMRDKIQTEIGSTLAQLAFTLEEDTWQGNHSLLLKIKDLRP